MNQLDLLIENYFTESFETSDLLRLVEQVMDERGLLLEAELGKPFEYVVVQVAREKAGAKPIDGGDYEKAKAGGVWRNARFGGKKGKTLEQLAVELYDMASKATDSRGAPIFSQGDFQTAKVTEVGKQKYGKGSTKVEIKSDIQFGDKTISLKLPGDVQAGSAEGVTQAEQLNLVLEDYIADAKNQVAKEEALRLRKLMKESEKEIMALAKRRFLGRTRQGNFSKEIAALPPGEDPSPLIQAYIDEGIMDATATFLDDRYYFDTEKLTAEVGAKVDQLFRSNDKLFKKLVRELLSGAIGFKDIPGAEAQFILNPEHLFDLADDKTIDIYGDALSLRVALKGGRGIGIESIDTIKRDSAAKASYRWDIKDDPLKKAIAEAKAKVEAEMRQLASLTSAATKGLGMPGSFIQMREEESQEQSLDLENMFDRAYDDITIDIADNFEQELKDSID
tara:strand:+ start:127 stop:1476 length:1350 start_codon:yes stop_codon:yes gene_type:complete